MNPSNEDIRKGLWNSQGLTLHEKMVALCVAHYRSGRYSNLAQRYIARRTGLSLRAVNRALASLQEKSILAIWPGEKDFCKYEFNAPVFVLNSTPVSRTPPQEKPIKFSADAGCIPAWEAEKQHLGNYPPESEIAKSEFEALIRLCQSRPKPEPIEPWELGWIDGSAKAKPGANPVDLSVSEWAKHEQRANELMGRA